MTLKLYLHPLSSYCHKALMAFYENDIPFEPVLIDGSTFAEFKQLWPIGKFPLLRDEARDQLVPNPRSSSSICSCTIPASGP